MRWLRCRWVDLVWLLAIGLASSCWCLTAAGRLGATFDEPLYLKAGMASWHTGSNKLLMRAGTMTLPIDVQTLPIYLWEQYRGQDFDPVTDFHTILPVARAANLTFWWVLLIFTMRLGRTFGGPWGGRLAMGIVACDPNLLGHTSLATTDIAIVACLLVLIDQFWRGLGCRWTRRVLIPGLCYGLAILAKASGLVFGMEAMAVLGLWHLARSRRLVAPGNARVAGRLVHVWRETHGLRKDLAWIAAIGLVFAFVYTGCDWRTEPTFIKWAEQLPDGELRSAMIPVSRNLPIFTNAGEGLLYQIKHNVRGHGTYFLGEWHPRATPWYFPVALSMKLPDLVFLLLAFVLLVHPRHLVSPPAAIAVLLLALSFNYRVQIGVRFMFTMVVLGYVGLAVAVARGWASADGRAVPRGFVLLMLAGLAAEAVATWPHGLSYCNAIWGGPDEGPRLLHDSNSDWGQGLPELKEWCVAHDEQVAVWYYGMDPAVNGEPFHRAHLSLLEHDGTTAGIRKLCPNTNYLAVSVGCLYGNADLTPPHRSAVEWARTQSPVARTRHFVIYRLR